jgi:hypothetical protein
VTASLLILSDLGRLGDFLTSNIDGWADADPAGLPHPEEGQIFQVRPTVIQENNPGFLLWETPRFSEAYWLLKNRILSLHYCSVGVADTISLQ